MTIETIAQLLSAAAVTAGVILALVQLRQFRQLRERTSAMELLHSFQTPEFAKAIVLVYGLPDGLSRDEIIERLGDDLHLVYAMTTTWESLGVLVFRREISLDMVADFFSGPIVLSWQKLQNYFREEREKMGRPTIGEWFEWLRDRLVEAEFKTPPLPAHIEHRGWKPPARH